MSDPVNPWLDPTEVRYLAEKLLRPVEQAIIQNDDNDLGAKFEGFTPNIDIQETSSPHATSTVVQPSNLDASISQKIDHLITNTGAKGALLVEKNGDLIFSTEETQKYAFVLQEIAASSQNITPLHLRLGQGYILQLIPCKSEASYRIFAGIYTKPLGAEKIDEIKVALS